MTRRSKREVERALEELSTRPSSLSRESCSDCGGAPAGTDAREGVTAPFATLECVCDAEPPASVSTIGQGAPAADAGEVSRAP